MRIFDRHRRVVDEDADRQRQAAERHRIDRLAEKIEDDERREDRQRYGDHDDEGRAPRAQEQYDHQRRQAGGDRAFPQQSDDRVLDEDRLIEQRLDFHAARRCGSRGLQRLLDRVDDRERRGVAVLDDAEQNRLAPFRANDVLLDQPAVVNLAHILDEHRRVVDELDRDVVEIVDRRRKRVGPHRVLLVSQLRGPRRDGEGLCVHGVDDIVRGQAFGLQFQRVDIHHDLAILSPGRGRQRYAVNRRKLLAHPIDAVVVELGAVERV